MKYLKAVPISFLFLFLYWPLFNLINQNHSFQITFDLQFRHDFIFTVWQATASTLLFLVVTGTISFFWFFSTWKINDYLAKILLIPFFLPIMGIASIFQGSKNLYPWRLFIGHSNFVDIIIANLVFNLGFGIFYLRQAFRNLNPEILAAGEVDGLNRSQIFFKLLIPLAKSNYRFLILIFFNFAITDLGTILLFGSNAQNTLESRINQSITQNYGLAKAISYALIQFVLLIIVTTLLKANLGNETPTQSGNYHLKSKKSTEIPAFLSLLFFSIPVFIYLWKVLSQLIIQHATQTMILPVSIPIATWNSMRNALCATFFSFLLALLLLVSGKKLSRVTIFSIGFSPTVLSLAAILTFSSGRFPLRDSWLIIPIFESLTYFPIWYFLIYPIWQQINSDYFAELKMAGGDQIDEVFYIYWPILKIFLLKTSLMVFIFGMADFVYPFFLTNGNQQTITVLLYQLFTHQNAASNLVSAQIFAILITIGVAMALIIKFSQKRIIKEWS